MKTLFVIPARGGSKGLPGKNIKPLNNKPLIYYSIDIARKFVSDKMICVSTDDDEIIKCVEAYGIKVQFKRPAELASDTSSTYDVIKHAVSKYDSASIDTVVLLQPTSPFRLYSHVNETMKLFTTGIDAVYSVKVTHANPYSLLYVLNQDGFIEKVMKGNYGDRRQDLPTVYELNGAIYVYNCKSLLERNPANFSKIRHYVMPELNSVDIDTPIDWAWAEFLLEKKLIQLDY